MTVPMITREELTRWAPHARQDYADALLAGERWLREAGILDSKLTLSHFLGQVGAETDGLVIVRESMNYSSMTRIKQVWPSRAGRVTPDLVHNERALADWAYGGRMGNQPPPSDDGYNFRGGGYIQTTGKEMVAKYCAALGIPLTSDVLSDPHATLRFACFEWQQSGCNRYAQANDLLSVAKIINTGSAKSGVTPNGMSDRRQWFARAWNIFGDNRLPMAAASSVTAKQLKDAGSETISHGDAVQKIGAAGAVASAIKGFHDKFDLPIGAADPPHDVVAAAPNVITAPFAPPVESVPVPDVFDHMSNATAKLETATTFAGAIKQMLTGVGVIISDNLWLIGLLLSGAAVFFGWKIIKRRVTDARLGLNTSRLDQIVHLFDPNPRTQAVGNLPAPAAGVAVAQGEAAVAGGAG